MPHELTGITAAYKGDGRKLGCPTANFAADTNLQEGVYFGYADLGDYRNHPSMVFVGAPVTMGETEHRIEVHLFDIPNVDYYGLPITVHLLKFHRSNEHFLSIEQLKSAMRQDEFAARAWLGSQNRV